jgi:hypothetical protein
MGVLNQAHTSRSLVSAVCGSHVMSKYIISGFRELGELRSDIGLTLIQHVFQSAEY